MRHAAKSAQMDGDAVVLITTFFTPEERPRLETEVSSASRRLNACLRAAVSIPQREALLSLLADVVGGHVSLQSGDFETSDLIKALNQGAMQLAAASFFQFVYVKGQPDNRAWRKRDAESKLFRTGRTSSQRIDKRLL